MKKRVSSIDRRAIPIIDPTENVKALSAADTKRQDDLRLESEKLATLRAEHVKELAQIRSEYERMLHRLENAAFVKTETAINVRLHEMETNFNTALDRAEKRVTEKVDPLTLRVTELEKGASGGSGKEQGIKLSGNVIIAAVLILSSLPTILSIFNRSTQQVQSPPQIIYTPAPPGTLVPSGPKP